MLIDGFDITAIYIFLTIVMHNKEIKWLIDFNPELQLHCIDLQTLSVICITISVLLKCIGRDYN